MDQPLSKSELCKAMKAIMAFSVNANRMIDEARRKLIIDATPLRHKEILSDFKEAEHTGLLFNDKFFESMNFILTFYCSSF